MKVKVRNRIFNCHRAVLGSHSTFFQNEIAKQNGHSNHVIEISDANPDVFESLLKMVYTGTDLISDDSADDFCQLASKLNFEFAEKRAKHYVSKVIRSYNWHGLWDRFDLDSERNICRQLFKNILDDGRYSDFTVTVGPQDFHLHKVILTSFSPFFNSLLSSNMVEARENKLTLQDIDPAAFHDLIQMLYVGNDGISCEHIEDIFKISSLMCLDYIKEKCSKYIIERICLDNCVGVWKIGKSYDDKDMKSAACEIISANLVYVIRQDEFLSLCKIDILEIINLVDRKEGYKEAALSGILRWAGNDWKKRRFSIQDLFQSMQLPDEDIVCDCVFQWVLGNPGDRKRYLENMCESIASPEGTPGRMHGVSPTLSQKLCKMCSAFLSTDKAGGTTTRKTKLSV